MESYESTQVAEIAKWKHQEPWIISNALSYALAPVNWLLSVVVPESAISGILTGASWLGEQMSDRNDILTAAGVSTIDELANCQLETLDGIANEVHNWAIAFSSAEGAGTGALGLPGMAIDIPASITLAMRTIHKIGLCYGFECKTEQDRNMVLSIMSSAGANSQEEKIAALASLQMLKVTISSHTWKKIAEVAVQRELKSGIENALLKNMNKEGAVIAIKGLAKQLGVNISKRKALQAIPAFGALVGASVNGVYMKDIGWAARRAYQERWLAKKYSDLENHTIDVT